MPKGPLCSGRPTLAHTASFRASPRARSRHLLGVAHVPLLHRPRTTPILRLPTRACRLEPPALCSTRARACCGRRFRSGAAHPCTPRPYTPAPRARHLPPVLRRSRAALTPCVHAYQLNSRCSLGPLLLYRTNARSCAPRRLLCALRVCLRRAAHRSGPMPAVPACAPHLVPLPFVRLGRATRSPAEPRPPAVAGPLLPGPHPSLHLRPPARAMARCRSPARSLPQRLLLRASAPFQPLGTPACAARGPPARATAALPGRGYPRRLASGPHAARLRACCPSAGPRATPPASPGPAPPAPAAARAPVRPRAPRLGPPAARRTPPALGHRLHRAPGPRLRLPPPATLAPQRRLPLGPLLPMPPERAQAPAAACVCGWKRGREWMRIGMVLSVRGGKEGDGRKKIRR
jgi:hypothetical protein